MSIPIDIYFYFERILLNANYIIYSSLPFDVVVGGVIVVIVFVVGIVTQNCCSDIIAKIDEKVAFHSSQMVF